jgi:hypothetical protein
MMQRRSFSMGSRKTAPGTTTDPAQPAPGEVSQDWRLPSGQDLISFAMSTGFTVRPLLAEEADVALESEKDEQPAKGRAMPGRQLA